MSAPFEMININEKVSDISKKIKKNQGAVLVVDLAGITHIITKYDMIEAIAG